MRDELGETVQPTAYQMALHEEQRMEQAERERLLYVALTRARDYLILSGATARLGADAWLSRLLAALGYPPESGGIPAGVYGPLQVWQH
jgi:ATP-dependent helicase/nuclease subunit A